MTTTYSKNIHLSSLFVYSTLDSEVSLSSCMSIKTGLSLFLNLKWKFYEQQVYGPILLVLIIKSVVNISRQIKTVQEEMLEALLLLLQLLHVFYRNNFYKKMSLNAQKPIKLKKILWKFPPSHVYAEIFKNVAFS